MDRARALAVEIIHEIKVKGAYANVALAKRLRQADLTECDRRFLTELVYGTTKAEGTIDYILGKYLKQPLKKLPPKILAILRMGVYQLYYMDRVPVSAAINTAVELAKIYNTRPISNMVNAILRNISREQAIMTLPEEETAEALAIREMHPKWMVEEFIRLFGYEEAEALCKLNNGEAPLVIRTNTLRITRDTLMTSLAKLGVSGEKTQLTPEGIIIREHGSLDKLTPLKEGLCQVQDESSMQVAHVLSPKSGELIIDACAAPGGKATHIAELMGNKGRIIALDVMEHKLQLIAANAGRLGIDIIETRLLDARKIGEEYAGLADRVLVDAPCSGLGVLRRKADARWRKKLADIKALNELQREIIASAARAVKAGGILVYSTCTITSSENHDIIQGFLANNKDFVLDRAGTYLPRKRDEDMVALYPQRDNTDGFFIARMRRLN